MLYECNGHVDPGQGWSGPEALGGGEGVGGGTRGRQPLPRLPVVPHEGRQGLHEVVVDVAAGGAGVSPAVVTEETQSLVGRNHNGFTTTAL